MLIFVIPSSYPTHINSQANIFVHEQCIALKKAGCEVVVLDAMSFRWKYWLDKTCYKTTVHQKDGIVVYSKHIQSLLKNRLFGLAVTQYRGVIKKLFEKAIKNYGKPDLIYAHFTYPSGYVSCEIAKKYNIPLMVLEHGGLYMKPKIESYLKRILKKTVSESQLFACVSDAQREFLYKFSETGKEIKIINNMIDDRFKYHPIVDNDKFVFFSAGNLYKVKRMDVLVNAFVNTFAKEDNVILKIAGEGAERKKLETLIKENNREHQVQLLGRLNRDEMLEEYVKCNVFALMSEHESFGIAYREAMAVGRPIVSSDNGGISTGWKDNYGRIVPIGDVKATEEALKYVYTNYGSYDLKKISDDCVDCYASRNVARRVIDEMDRIIKGERE